MPVDGGDVEVLRPTPQDLDEAWLSRPEHVVFPSTDLDGVAEAHALVYPPTNPEVSGPAGELPPLVVACTAGRPPRRPRC